jgi:hypothetical protein
MFAEQAIEACKEYMEGATMAITFALMVMVIESGNEQTRKDIITFLLLSSRIFFMKALSKIDLDSRLLDLDPSVEEHGVGFHHALVDITLETFQNDDECQAKTRFTKEQIRNIIAKLELNTEIRVY